MFEANWNQGSEEKALLKEARLIPACRGSGPRIPCLMYFLFHSNIDPCKASKPCKNNAICANSNGDYRCICKPGYQGKNCEQGDT